MPALSHVPLEVEAYVHTTTANTVAGTSANLTADTEYLILASGNQASTGPESTLLDMALLVGSTVLARAAGDRGAFAPSGSVETFANLGFMPIGVAARYTPPSSEAMTVQAWSGTANGTAYCRCYAIDISNIPGPGSGDSQARWHAETDNTDTIVDTPTSGYETVGDELTFTAPRAGSYWILASVELVEDGTNNATDEFDARLMLDGSEVDGTWFQHDVTSRSGATTSNLWIRIITLTAASHTFGVEVNGTSSNGNVGARRIHIHAIEVAAIEDEDAQQATEASESLGSAIQDIDPAGHAITIGNGSADYLVFGQWQKQLSRSAEAFFLLSGAEFPTNGFGEGVEDFGAGATDDVKIETGLAVASAPAGSTALATRISKVSTGSQNVYGTDVNRGTPGDMYLIAIRLASSVRVVMASPLPLPLMDASGNGASAGSTATMSADLPLPLAVASAGASTVAAVAADLPIVEASIAGTAGASIGAAVVADLPLPLADIEAAQGAVATVAADLPLPLADIEATSAHPVALAVDLPIPVLEAAPTVATGAALAVDLPIPVLDGETVRGHDATLSADLPPPLLDASSNVALPPSAALAVDLPIPVLDGVAQRPASADLSAELPTPEATIVVGQATSALLSADLPVVLADFDTQAAPVGTLNATLPAPEMLAVGDAPPDPDSGSGGEGEAVWSPHVWIPRHDDGKAWTPAPWGSVLGGDILAGLSDDFSGASLDPAFTVEDVNGALDGSSGIVSGEYNMRMIAGGGSGSWWYDDNAGIIIGHEIVGPFMARTRVRVRNDADTAAPPTGGFGKYMGIAAHDPDRSALNYVHVVAGSDVGASIEWKTTDAIAGGSTNTTAWDPLTVPPNTTIEVDLQLVRRASNQQIFDLSYRDATGGHRLQDDDPAFTPLQTIDRTDNATPPRSANGAAADLAVPLPARLLVGMVGYSVQAADDVQGFFDGILFSRDHPSII